MDNCRGGTTVICCQTSSDQSRFLGTRPLSPGLGLGFLLELDRVRVSSKGGVGGYISRIVD